MIKRALAADDVARLARSAERLVALAKEISERGVLTNGLAPNEGQLPEVPHANGPEVVDTARRLAAEHAARPDFGLADLFRDRAWLLVLELYVADARRIEVAVKSACLTLGGSQSSALRTLLHLEQDGVVQSRSDAKDARRRLITLTPAAHETLSVYLAQHPSTASRVQMSLRITSTTDDSSPSSVCGANRAGKGSNSAQSESGLEVALQ